MTLGGLVLAVGILVDISTAAIENIHTYLTHRQGVERAVLDWEREVAIPLLIAMLWVVTVFLPLPWWRPREPCLYPQPRPARVWRSCGSGDYSGAAGLCSGPRSLSEITDYLSGK
jgi:hypothetical protein